MKSKKKIIILCLTALLLLSVPFTIAYLHLHSGINNEFTTATVEPEIVESFAGNVKRDVAVKNNGNISVYVRCKVAVYFETKTGNISATVPKINDDYTIDFGNNSDWFKAGDIYYYKNPLPAGEQTSVLIKEAKSLNNKKLVVDISAQSLQADPSSAVSEAWKDISVTKDGNLQANGGNINAQ